MQLIAFDLAGIDDRIADKGLIHRELVPVFLPGDLEVHIIAVMHAGTVLIELQGELFVFIFRGIIIADQLGVNTGPDCRLALIRYLICRVSQPCEYDSGAFHINGHKAVLQSGFHRLLFRADRKLIAADGKLYLGLVSVRNEFSGMISPDLKLEAVRCFLRRFSGHLRILQQRHAEELIQLIGAFDRAVVDIRLAGSICRLGASAGAAGTAGARTAARCACTAGLLEGVVNSDHVEIHRIAVDLVGVIRRAVHGHDARLPGNVKFLLEQQEGAGTVILQLEMRIAHAGCNEHVMIDLGAVCFIFINLIIAGIRCEFIIRSAFCRLFLRFGLIRSGICFCFGLGFILFFRSCRRLRCRGRRASLAVRTAAAARKSDA